MSVSGVFKSLLIDLKFLIDTIARMASISENLNKLCKKIISPFSHSENSWRECLTPLSSKILNLDEKKQIEPYLGSLKEAIENENYQNVALIGSYGSGKSTVLKTLENGYKKSKCKFIKVSLATFSKEKSDDINTEQREGLERAILEQIFYSTKASDIPDSRFKRITITHSRTVLALMLWLWNLTLEPYKILQGRVSNLLEPAYQFIQDFQHFKEEGLFCTTIIKSLLSLASLVTSLVLFLLGLFLLLKTILVVLKKSSLTQMMIKKDKIELGINDNDKSVLNKHLDEILYFFEKTKSCVLLIEDLDRFKDIEIFNKLRELNILINNSETVKQKVTFIYAIDDQLFKNPPYDRVKFFDLVIPIIPHINPLTAKNKFQNLIKANPDRNLKFKDALVKELFLHIKDIDTRLLNNIFNEFLIYQEVLKLECLDVNELLAIIVYKNLCPLDFRESCKQRGELHKLFNEQKDHVIHCAKETKQNDIKTKQKHIQDLEEENLKNINELNAVYIMALYKLHPNCGPSVQILNSAKLTFEDLSSDNSFQSLIDNGFQLTDRSNHDNFTFEDLERAVNSNGPSYNTRRKNIEDRSNNQIQTIENEINDLKKQVRGIESKMLKDFTDVSSQIGGNAILKEPAIKFLIEEGYINENYPQYITLFHEGGLTKQGWEFLHSVLSNKKLDYAYKLNNIPELIDAIPDKYFKKPVILNFHLLDFLINPHNGYGSQLESFIETINEYKEEEFIKSYIVFNYESDRFDEGNREPSSYFDLELIDKKKYFFSKLTFKLKDLQALNSIHPKARKEILEQGTLYEINEANLRFILHTEPTYENILSSDNRLRCDYVDHHINDYVKDVLLKTPSITEPEKSLLELWNHQNLKLDLKFNILQRCNPCLNIDIEEINNLEMRMTLLNSDKLTATWKNVFNHYNSLTDSNLDDTLIKLLNDRHRYHTLVKEEIPDEFVEEVNKFCSQLILDKRIEALNFDQLLNTLAKHINDNLASSLDLNSILPEKLVILIKRRLLKFNKYRELEDGEEAEFDENNTFFSHLLEADPEGEGGYPDLKITKQSACQLLISKSFKLENKIKLVENHISSDLIDVILEHKLHLEDELIKTIIKKSSTELEKIRLFNQYNKNFTKETRKEILMMFGEPYSKLFSTIDNKKTISINYSDSDKQHKEELLNNLKVDGLIKKYEDTLSNKFKIFLLEHIRLK